MEDSLPVEEDEEEDVVEVEEPTEMLDRTEADSEVDSLPVDGVEEEGVEEDPEEATVEELLEWGTFSLARFLCAVADSILARSGPGQFQYGAPSGGSYGGGGGGGQVRRIVLRCRDLMLIRRFSVCLVLIYRFVHTRLDSRLY